MWRWMLFKRIEYTLFCSFYWAWMGWMRSSLLPVCYTGFSSLGVHLFDVLIFPQVNCYCRCFNGLPLHQKKWWKSSTWGFINKLALYSDTVRGQTGETFWADIFFEAFKHSAWRFIIAFLYISSFVSFVSTVK